MSPITRLLLSLIVATLISSGYGAPVGASGPAGLECRVVLQPDDVASQPEPVALQVLLPGQVGDAIRGRVEQASGIDVLAVGTEDSGVTVVTLDTSAAIAGDWFIRFDAEEGTCGGRLTIADSR